MKELHGSASAPVTASVERCFELFEAVDGYPQWYPEAVRRVEVVQRAVDGKPARAQAQLHVAYGPLTREFNLLLSVEADPLTRVKLTRLAHEPPDPERFEVTWLVQPGRIELQMYANLSIPRLVPVSGVGESFAGDFVAAAKKVLDGRAD
jgi:ribosome-associated toxin RatA of RatAB toxin-antitoxin module